MLHSMRGDVMYKYGVVCGFGWFWSARHGFVWPDLIAGFEPMWSEL